MSLCLRVHIFLLLVLHRVICCVCEGVGEHFNLWVWLTWFLVLSTKGVKTLGAIWDTLVIITKVSNYCFISSLEKVFIGKMDFFDKMHYLS